jgi:hypothetical protein
MGAYTFGHEAHGLDDSEHCSFSSQSIPSVLGPLLGLTRESPIVFFLLACAIGSLAFPLLLRIPPPQRKKLLTQVSLAAGLLTLIAYVTFALLSLRSFVLEASEANILSIAAASLHGQPVYHPTHSPNLSYTAPYGPLTFLLYRAVLVASHGDFRALRAIVVLGSLLLPVALYSIFRKFAPTTAALALLAFPLCPLLQFLAFSFGVRADIWIVLAMAIAVRCCLMESKTQAAVLTGLFSGIAMGFKLTVAPAFLFLLLVLYRRKGPKAVALATLVALAITLAPFSLPEISLPNYFAWLVVARSEGVIHTLFLFHFFYALFMLTPLVALSVFKIGLWPQASLKPFPAQPALLVLCLLATIFVASKPGGGPWHLWQFLPLITAYIALTISASSAANSLRLDYAICLITLSSAAYGLSFTARNAGILRPPSTTAANHLQAARQELNDDLTHYQGHVIQMGYGQTPNEPVELLRYLLPLHGQPYTLDGIDRIEALLVPFPPGLIGKMNNCSGDIWLVPSGERPFAHPWFSQTLRDTFIQHYSVQQRSPVYDVWSCNAFQQKAPTP